MRPASTNVDHRTITYSQPQLRIHSSTHPLSQLHKVAVDINTDHTPRAERPHDGNSEVPLVAADVQALLAFEPGPPHKSQSRVAGADESELSGGCRGGFRRRAGTGGSPVPVAGAVIACSVKRERTNEEERGRLYVFPCGGHGGVKMARMRACGRSSTAAVSAQDLGCSAATLKLKQMRMVSRTKIIEKGRQTAYLSSVSLNLTIAPTRYP